MTPVGGRSDGPVGGEADGPVTGEMAGPVTGGILSRDAARGVWWLALGQTSGYAAVFFSFASLLVTLERETGWSRADMALGPTLGLLTAALVAPLVGRLADRGRGGVMLWTTAAFGGLCLLGLSRVTSLTGWYALWMLNGVAQAGSLFETCFTFLTRRLGPAARTGIVRVTLVSGFAASLAFPLGAFAGLHFGWRGGFVAFAALELLVTAPLNLIGVTLLGRGDAAMPHVATRGERVIGPALRRPAFWLIAVILAALWLNHTLLTTYAVPVLIARGLPEPMAVLIAAAIGPMQVLGRFFFMTGGAGMAPVPGMRLVAAGFVLASLILAAASGNVLLLWSFALFQGLSAGVVSILRPLLIADVLGQRHFGAIAGMIAMAPLGAMAAAPVVGAVLLQAGGVVLLLAVTTVLGLLALAAAVLIRRGADAPG